MTKQVKKILYIDITMFTINAVGILFLRSFTPEWATKIQYFIALILCVKILLTVISWRAREKGEFQ